MPSPTQDLRSNLGTWAVPPGRLPAVARLMQALAPEPYDRGFRGQYLQTTYLDTAAFALRKARQQGRRYLTLRLRAYAPAWPPGGAYPEPAVYLSAKTEARKYRTA